MNYLDYLKTALILLGTLGVLVTIHEWGHFWVARRCGIKVLRFSVGFGMPLYKWSDKQGTEYVIAALPLGGYVKMLDEREGDVPSAESHLAFNRKSVSARLATVLAGPFVNILFAVFLYWIIFANGVTNVAPIVGSVIPDSLAAHSGLQAGQEIVEVDGHATPSWEKVSLRLVRRVGDTGSILLTVKTPPSNETQQLSISIGDWLVGESVTDTLKSVGIEPWRLNVPPVVGSIAKGGRAEVTGLRVGDEIITADGKPIKDWRDWVDLVRASPEHPLKLLVNRQGRQLSVDLTPASKVEDGKTIGFIGAGAQPVDIPKDMLRETNYTLLGALVPALEKTWDMSVVTIKSIGKMIEGKLSIKNLSGPITMAKLTSDSAKVGLLAFIGFLAFLSLSLGVINLLPIPVLDGGHVVFYLIEGLVGKPLPDKVQEISVQMGMAIVIGLSLIAIYNDILRL